MITTVDFEEEKKQEVRSSIFAFNISEHKLYIYSEDGLLLKRISYKKLTSEYGDIMSASSDGLNFVLFNKPKDTATIVRFYSEGYTILKTFRIK